MIITIKYKNYLGDYIDESEATMLAEFSKIFFLRNKLKREEKYIDNVLIGGVYYLYDGERYDEVMGYIGTELLRGIYHKYQK